MSRSDQKWEADLPIRQEAEDYAGGLGFTIRAIEERAEADEWPSLKRSRTTLQAIVANAKLRYLQLMDNPAPGFAFPDARRNRAEAAKLYAAIAARLKAPGCDG